MRKEIIREISPLKQQVWHFELSVSSGKHNYIYLDNYWVNYKDNERQRKWRISNADYWNRYDKRSGTINVPPLPDDVIKEARQYFVDQIMETPITL